jgi:DNA-binding PadR family transcriptional regulator
MRGKVLELISKVPCHLSQISKTIKYGLSTVHKILTSFKSVGYIDGQDQHGIRNMVVFRITDKGMRTLALRNDVLKARTRFTRGMPIIVGESSRLEFSENASNWFCSRGERQSEPVWLAATPTASTWSEKHDRGMTRVRRLSLDILAMGHFLVGNMVRTTILFRTWPY